MVQSVFVSAAVVFSLLLQHEPSIGLEGNTGASTGTLTSDDEGVKFFPLCGVSVLYYLPISALSLCLEAAEAENAS